jgi:hypothetical protein
MAATSESPHLPPLRPDARRAVGQDLEATLLELIDLSLFCCGRRVSGTVSSAPRSIVSKCRAAPVPAVAWPATSLENRSLRAVVTTPIPPLAPTAMRATLGGEANLDERASARLR